MSKQKSTKTETQRFSGPELSELLDQVAREHGAGAAISAVNKIRSGGVAGFFCREEFEVVVQGKPAPRARKRTPKADASPKPAPRSDIAPSNATTAAAPAALAQQPRSDIAPATTNTPARTNAPLTSAPAATTAPAATPQAGGLAVTTSLQAVQAAAAAAAAAMPSAPLKPTALSSTATASPPVTNPVDVSDTSVGADDTVFAGPRPMGGEPAVQSRFRALLEQRLDEVTDAEHERTGRFGSSLDQPAPRAERAGPAPAPKPEPNLQPIVPAPGLPISVQTVTGGLDVLTPEALTATAVQSSDFWLRLQRAQHELASFMPLASATVATIGPLSLTTPIVQRLRTQPGLESADVIVLTDRAEIVSEPTWKLVRSGHQLVDAALEQGDWPTLILIDVPVELPNWVAPLENRLRIAGVGLFRYAVPGNPTADQLDDYRLGSDVPYVIDLISRVSPEDLVDFVAKRHPIASVSGADLNAELLLAMREQVALGP